MEDQSILSAFHDRGGIVQPKSALLPVRSMAAIAVHLQHRLYDIGVNDRFPDIGYRPAGSYNGFRSFERGRQVIRSMGQGSAYMSRDNDQQRQPDRGRRITPSV